MEGEAGRGCRAAGVAGAWSPHGGRALARSGRDARERRGAVLRQAGRGARERRALQQAGPASAVGREARRQPVKEEKHFSIFDFQENFK